MTNLLDAGRRRRADTGDVVGDSVDPRGLGHRWLPKPRFTSERELDAEVPLSGESNAGCLLPGAVDLVPQRAKERGDS
jgi:hypothetical protein